MMEKTMMILAAFAIIGGLVAVLGLYGSYKNCLPKLSFYIPEYVKTVSLLIFLIVLLGLWFIVLLTLPQPEQKKPNEVKPGITIKITSLTSPIKVPVLTTGANVGVTHSKN